VNHAIPLAMNDLPLHYLNILVAVELKTAPKLDTNGKAYEFEGEVLGYYNDPCRQILETTGLRNQNRLTKPPNISTKTLAPI